MPKIMSARMGLSLFTLLSILLPFVSFGAAAENFAWSLPTDISIAGQHAGAPQIKLSADGTRATAVWVSGTEFCESGTCSGNSFIQTASAVIVGNTATWGSVIELSATDQSANADSPSIALSADGTRATAIWRRYNGSEFIIQAASAAIPGNTATWGSVTGLSAIGQSADSPNIALSADGARATAAWNRPNGSLNIIQSASATITGNTATWGNVTNLSATERDAYSPGIGLSADGTYATAIWLSYDGSYNGGPNIIQSASATISGTTATWGNASDLSAAGDSYGPKIALSSDGNRAIGIWYRNNIIQTAPASVTGIIANWGSVSELSGPSNDPQIALSADGTRATATWTSFDMGFSSKIQSCSATIIGNTATWGSVTDLSAFGQLDFGQASHARLALSLDGTRAAAIWSQNVIGFNGNQFRSASINGNTAIWESVTDLLNPC